MIFGRKYPLCYDIPYDDASCGSSVTVTKTRYVATDGKIRFIFDDENNEVSYESTEHD